MALRIVPFGRANPIVPVRESLCLRSSSYALVGRGHSARLFLVDRPGLVILVIECSAQQFKGTGEVSGSALVE
ncbi:hypothetical protein L1987_89030 [Smallanthus sonchifolius]|nr:hypothetical protein L1987_89030 [Smallanthus sonchifolius]